MSAPIIPAEAAQTFNAQVQAIDPRLFLFCNYEPTVNYATSLDARCLVAIQDLYKFAVDSNYVLNHYREFIPEEDWKAFGVFDNICQEIKNLRTILDHNQSEGNGYLEKTRLEWYKTWREKVPGELAKENLEGDALVYRKLELLAKKLLEQTDRFVTRIKDRTKTGAERKAVVEMWIEKTLFWYTHNTKTEIYKGCLMDAYLANSAGKLGVDARKPWVVHRKVNKWIKKGVEVHCEKRDKVRIGVFQQRIDILQKMAPDKLAQWERDVGTTFEEQKKWLEELQARKTEAQKAVVEGKAIGYFFNGLEGQLRATVKRLDAKGTAYTLLPQDLMQMDIEFYFNEDSIPDAFGGGVIRLDRVPSPEEDF